jgi:hypothetical protein
MPSPYFGFYTETIPLTVPSSIEVQNTAIVSQTRNPFTGQTIQYSWGVQYKEISVSLPPMYQSDANYWLTFFDTINGTANVFSFNGNTCRMFPYELTFCTGVVASSASTTVALSSNASSVDGFYIGQTILIDYGTGSGQTNYITAYVGSSRTATVSTAWSTNPDTTSIFSIPRYFRLKSPTSQWSVKEGVIYYFTFECQEVII